VRAVRGVNERPGSLNHAEIH